MSGDTGCTGKRQPPSTFFGRHCALVECQSGCVGSRFEKNCEIAKIEIMANREKSPSSRDLGSGSYELVIAHCVTQVDRRPPRHDELALATTAHISLIQAMRGPGEKWTASSTKMGVLIGEPGLPLLGKAYKDREPDRFSTYVNCLDCSGKRATYYGDSGCPEHHGH